MGEWGCRLHGGARPTPAAAAAAINGRRRRSTSGVSYHRSLFNGTISTSTNALDERRWLFAGQQQRASIGGSCYGATTATVRSNRASGSGEGLLLNGHHHALYTRSGDDYYGQEWPHSGSRRLLSDPDLFNRRPAKRQQRLLASTAVRTYRPIPWVQALGDYQQQGDMEQRRMGEKKEDEWEWDLRQH